MATYEQLKEEITAKVVAALTEKLTKKVEEGAKPDFLDLDGDGDKKEPMKKAAKDKELKKEEEELEERRKRDTPRDSDRREPEKLKINEDDELEEILDYTDDDSGQTHADKIRASQHRDKDRSAKLALAKTGEEKEELDEIGAQEPYVDGDREDEETMEEAVSNDQWYHGELFESLVKKWAK